MPRNDDSQLTPPYDPDDHWLHPPPSADGEDDCSNDRPRQGGGLLLGVCLLLLTVGLLALLGVASCQKLDVPADQKKQEAPKVILIWKP